jgi:murein L,D-transpeptidase YafK
VSHADSSREIALLKNLADYFLTCLISAYPRSLVDSELVAADLLLKREDYEGALMHLERVSCIEPNSADFAGRKADVYMAMGKPGLAIPYLEWAAGLRGNSTMGRALAEAYKENGEFIKAIAEYEKLLSTEADPDWVRQQIIHLTRQKLLAAESLSKPSSLFSSPIPKQPDTLLWMPQDSRCAIVEKESQTLFLYRSTSQGYELEKTFACSTGARPGEKIAEGDERTPEGIYFLHRILPWIQLPDIYGRKAISLDYPNPFDRLEGKSGDGIWLHASNEPIRAYLPNKTRGCVVVRNEDIEELSNLLTLNQTPLIIVPKIRYRTGAELNAEREDIQSFLSEWRSSWEARQIDQYISLYSARFRNGELGIKDWEAVKKDVFARAGRIRLNIELQSIVRNERYAIATFRQDYHSDRAARQGIKRLFIVQESGAWKIIAEEM